MPADFLCGQRIYEPSRCGWAWVGFVVAEKADVEPLIERTIRIKLRYVR